MTGFDQILDEALALLQKGKSVAEVVALYPKELQAELKELLATAFDIKESVVASSAYKKMLGSLPAVTKEKKKSYLNALYADSAERLNSFLLNCMKKFAGKKILALGAVALAIVLLVYGGNTYFVGQSQRGTSELALPRSASMPLATGKASYSLNADSAAVQGDTGFAYPSPVPPIYYGGSAPASDTRELLKTTYYATIRTRNVSDDAMHAETIIKGHGGRIDSASIETKYAYVSFVVPKDQYDNFRTELKTIAGARFFTEQISQTNMLPEKRSIEDQTASNNDTLASLQKDRSSLVSRHQSVVSDLNNQIAGLNEQMNQIKQQEAIETDSAKLAELRSSYNTYLNQRFDLYRRLSAENNSYNKQISEIDNRIENVKSGLKNLGKQDQNLTDDVATVSGTITMQWVSIYDIVALYLPGPWLTIVVTLLIIVIVYIGFREKDVEVV